MKKLLQKWLGIIPDEKAMEEHFNRVLGEIADADYNQIHVSASGNGAFGFKYIGRIRGLIEKRVDQQVDRLLAQHIEKQETEIKTSEYIDKMVERINSKQLKS